MTNHSSRPATSPGNGPSTSDTPVLRIRQLAHPLLHIDDFTMRRGECWAVLGRNGAGKHQLGQLLTGKLDAPPGCLQHHFGAIRLLSFEAQQALYEKE